MNERCIRLDECSYIYKKASELFQDALRNRYNKGKRERHMNFLINDLNPITCGHEESDYMAYVCCHPEDEQGVHLL